MEKPASAAKAGVELDKFKRRLIRSVARLILHDKKPEDEIWKELKKETGCDCELLWIRMRALTLKKLDVLLSADDRMDAVPKPARMSLTDWLLFDLVLVHQKVDLIGQNKQKHKDCRPLVDLFELVKMFNIEYLSGDKLAGAWSLATLSYNNKGHHCSPMLLQRRWYQLKQLTRTKFYQYWYAYRGSVQRISASEPLKPSPLQTDIATYFKHLITKPFASWEELIQRGKVTMPDQFERLMQEKFAQRNQAPAPKPTEDVPDLVMIEPSVETIDLRLEPDDDVNEEDKQEDEGSNPVCPLVPTVKIKEEPIDEMDIDETQVQLPKKSIYEVVLETTTLENEQLDSIDTEDFVPENDDDDVEEIEETPVRDEEESTLPQIGSVFGNVSDTSVLGNIDEDRVYANADSAEVCDNYNDSTAVNVDHTHVRNDTNGSEVSDTIVLDEVEDSARRNEKETGTSDNLDESSARNNDEVIQLSDKDKEATDISDTIAEVTEHVDETSPVDGDIITVPGDENIISDDDDNDLGQVDVNPTRTVGDTNAESTVDKTSAIGTIDETTIAGNVHENAVGDNVEDAIEPAPSEGVVLDTPNICSAVPDSPSKDLEIVDTPSDPVVIINSDDEGDDIADNLVKAVTKSTVEDIVRHTSIIDQPMEVGLKPEVLSESLKVSLKEDAVKVEAKEEKDVKPIPGFNFGELPNDISFADDGIEFVDDGIVYVEEDGYYEPSIKKEAEDDDAPKIDAKLLMCPIVYTTRLDDMYSFHRRPFYQVRDRHLIKDIDIKSKPIKQEPKEPIAENVTVNYVGDNIASVTVNDTKTIEHVQQSVGTIEKVAINNDSIVIIKKEPVNVESETSADVEHNPENDDNVTSDDDSDENVIDESRKVKPTSYLLQKPRSRRYNSIQLCKNPDFNTRLKRLSVGFFRSPRNRILIKSCKPLTVDLSKAFESKLVSGTLYLKPVDHNVITEIRDDTENQNVSVLPSAMPAQSLIDNSKATDILPMIRQCLEASQKSQDSNSTTERNKVINLPDITEIRRINQKLLTAEVTPIQVHNNQPQVPVTIVTSVNSPSCTAHKTVTNPEPVENLQPRASEANDARGPPKLLDITDDPPPNSSANQYPTITISSSPHKSTAGNSFDTFRPQAPGHFAGRPPKMLNGKRVIPQKPSVWKPRQLRPEIPWLNKTNEVSVDSMMNETLLTMDALNKMLFLLNKNQGTSYIGINSKSKVPKKRKNAAHQTNKTRGRSKTNPKNSSAKQDPAREDESSDTQNTCQKPKINIKAATNCPRGKGKGDDSSKKKLKYCCWARQRMLQLLFGRANIPPHDCPRLCACCCRHLLADYIMQDNIIKDAECQKIQAAGIAFDLTNDTIESEDSNSCSSVLCEGYVQNAVGTPAQAPAVTVPEDTPAVYIDVINKESGTENILENEPISIDDTEDDVPALGGEVSVKTTTVVNAAAAVADPPRGIPAPVTVRRTVVAVPLVKNHKVISRETPEVVNSAYQVTHISSDKQSGGVISIIPNATTTPSITVGPNMISTPIPISKFLAAKKLKTPNKYKKTLPPPILYNKANKTFVPPKNFKEKMIFLNSKQISEKPTASPVFLGKNKILLTTVKFPPNLKLFQEAKKALRNSLILPNGVHLILQTDGKISYKIDQNVEVNAMDMAGMPAIIATIQAHMNAQEEAQKLQKSPQATVATESEIVDLVDDDDEPASNVNEDQQNTDTSVSELQPTEESATINSDDSLDVRRNSIMDTSKEMEEIAPVENINSNVINITIESNQNKTGDQCTITDIQEDQANIQDSSHNEIGRALTEQVEHDPSIEKVSAEIDDQPKPSSETVSTDAHEVSSEQARDQSKPSCETESSGIQEISTKQVQDQSKPLIETERTVVHEIPAEQVQDQSEPSGQNVSIELQDHPEATTQNVSTDVPEESRSEPNRPKTKNILSDLMEMSGIFDEDITPDVVASSVTPLCTPEIVQPPVQQPVVPSVSVGTPIMQSIPMPPSLIANSVPPTVPSPLGELTPITSLYELKYACANKGAFFKLDFKTGFLVPINVCMKPAVQKPPPPITSRIAPKSVIDLTDEDDKQEQNDKQIDIAPTKTNSLLIVNNSPPGGLAGTVKPGNLAVPGKADDLAGRIKLGGFTGPVEPADLAGTSQPADLAGSSKPVSFAGPVKPVKLFKSLKPNILQRLNINKMKTESWNPLYDRVALDQSIKRRKFLKSINMNANLALKPVRRYVRKMKHTDKTVDEPTATTSSLETVKEFATNILSDDDSSDDEPLAKIAKRKNDNLNAPDKNENTDESVKNNVELESPVADVEQTASVAKQIEPELPVADDENNMLVDDSVAGEAPAAEQNDAELPEADPNPVYMSDDDNDFMETGETFGFDLNDSNEEEDCCILGV